MRAASKFASSHNFFEHDTEDDGVDDSGLVMSSPTVSEQDFTRKLSMTRRSASGAALVTPAPAQPRLQLRQKTLDKLGLVSPRALEPLTLDARQPGALLRSPVARPR